MPTPTAVPVDRVLNTAGSAPELARAALLELVGPCIAVADDGRITAANDAAGELLGREAGTLVEMRVQALAPAANRAALTRKVGRVEAHGQTFLTRLERSDGTPFDAEIRAVRLGVGEDTTTVLALRDVTRAVQAEEHLWQLNADLEQRIAERTADLELLSDELERRRAYLETIVQQIPAGVVIADGTTGDVTMMNERGREISGSGPLDPLPTRAAWSQADGTRPDGTSYDPDEWPLARALAGEEVFRERVFVDDTGGTRRVLEFSAAPVHDSRGARIAAVALIQDVTAADARARAAADFVANAAHELRTPLAAIVSAVDVLEAGAKEIPAERDRFLAHLGRESDRLARLTAALLLLARLQSGVEESRAEIIPLAPVLAAVASSIRPARGVRVSVHCPNDAAAIASRGLLEQALTSIAGNSARYTDAGRITLSVAKRDDRVRIRVRDTGRGMEAGELVHAGRRFYRGNRSGASGFGLGLAIARESVEAMGGTLVLESEPAVGTTADILLPAARVVEA